MGIKQFVCHTADSRTCLATSQNFELVFKVCAVTCLFQCPCGEADQTTTLPAILLTLPPSKAADMAHLCVPQNQPLGVCRRFVPDI